MPDAESDAPWRADDHPPHSWPIGSVAGWRDGHGCPTTWCKGEGSRRDETFNTRVTSPGRTLMSALDLAVAKAAEDGCERAIRYLRDAKPGRAEYELVRTGIRIARLVDDVASVAVLEDLVYVDLGTAAVAS